MKKKSFFKGILSIALAICLIFSSVVPASAQGLSLEKVDNSAVESTLLKGASKFVEPENTTFDAGEIVRVSIFLKEKSAVEAGYSTTDILDNSAALKQITKIKNNQKTVQKNIEKAIKKNLDVKASLALVANVISADVAYGDIQKIASVSDVVKVVVETQYFPEKAMTLDSPNQAIATGYVTGAKQAAINGYNGAGARIAIIDTGLDIDHQSFDNNAFLHALEEDYNAAHNNSNNGKGILGAIVGIVKSIVKAVVGIVKAILGIPDAKTIDKISKEYKLLDTKELAKALPYLNVSERLAGVTADDLFISNKIPFGFNYVDEDLDVRHINDVQGEHGSHVAGIATANRYLVKNNAFVNASEEVGVVGNAPDAQILVMKVFGKAGGAYPSDYMDAIEDAIYLGCDSVNLSLGSKVAGFTTTEEAYQAILDRLETTNTVVVMSAGNNGAWADETFNTFLYADSLHFATGGSPATFKNSFSVASIDNPGTYDYGFIINGKRFAYTESTDYGNVSIITLANGGSATYPYVFIDGVGVESDYEGIDVNGKIVFVSRGESSFFEKANIAVANGAIATIIYNNQDGKIGLNLTGYEYTAPCVSITQADGAKILAASKQEGSVYTGTITIDTQKSAIPDESDYFTMSYYSSWGVPGNLSMKPEIAAPGGAIYSVYGTTPAGGGVDQYELMSGTSMAAPQMTGMSAVLKRYIEINKLSVKGMTDRALAQSLLMSTALPMVDANGDYYSVLQQGSGLGNVFDAMNANAYITMNDDATASAKDGKVKVELGEDPERNGVYTFSFNINNISKSNVTYKLNADVFTQALTYADEETLVMLGSTMALDANVKFTVDRKNVTSVTVKKGKSVTVTATIALSADDKEFLDVFCENGAYVEAYVFAEPTNNSSTLSIPVFGVYGSWTDSSMFDVGSYNEFDYGIETRAPYFYEYTDIENNYFTVLQADGEWIYGSNPYAYGDYRPDFASLNNENGDAIKSIYFSLIRNAANLVVKITNTATGEVYLNAPLGSATAAYFDDNNMVWRDTQKSLNLNWKGTDANGNKLPEGTQVQIDLIAVPELYCDAEGNFDESKLGQGAYFSTLCTIDNTAPEIYEAFIDEDGYLGVIAEDNFAIAAVAIFAENGRDYLGAVAVDDTSISAYLANELEEGVYLISVYDYAGNQSTYKIFYGVEPTDQVEFVELDTTELTLIKNNSVTLSAIVGPDNIIDDSVIWSTSDETVVTVDQNGKITAVGEGEAIVTATSVLDETMSASCYVEVITIENELNAVVWDENGEVWFSQFNTANLPKYEKLTEVSTDAAINNVVYLGDVLYASDIDTSNGVSVLYTVDQETFELTAIGQSEICYTSMAAAPSTTGLIGTYFNYVVLIDPETGDYLGAFNYLPDGELVGITYVGSSYNKNYRSYLDMYYLLDSEGNIYFEAFMPYNGGYVYFNGAEDGLMGATGIDCDTPYFQSLYFDGEFTYISNFNESANCVTLYVVDTEVSGNIFCLGQFDDGVWPVAGLFNLAPVAEVSADKAAAFENAVLNDAAAMAVENIQ